MRTSLKARLQRLEAAALTQQEGEGGRLPLVVPDDTPEYELEALRATCEVYRLSDFVDQAV